MSEEDKDDKEADADYLEGDKLSEEHDEDEVDDEAAEGDVSDDEKSDIEKLREEAEAFVTPAKSKSGTSKVQKTSSAKSSGKAIKKKTTEKPKATTRKRQRKTSQVTEDTEVESTTKKRKTSKKSKKGSEDRAEALEKRVLMKAGAVLAQQQDIADWEQVEKLASVAESGKLKEQWVNMKEARARAKEKQQQFMETSKRRIGEQFRWDLTKQLPMIFHEDPVLSDALKIRDLDPHHVTRHMERYLSDPYKETDGEGPFIIATFGLLKAANQLSLTDAQKRKLDVAELMDQYVFNGRVPAVQLAGLHRVATLRDLRDDTEVPAEQKEEFFRYHKAMVYDFPDLSLEYVKQCRLIGFQDNKIVMRQLSFTEKLEASRRIALLLTGGKLEKLNPEIRAALRRQINDEMGDEMKEQVAFFAFVAAWKKSSYDLLLAISKDEVMYRDGWPDPTQKAVLAKNLLAKEKAGPKGSGGEKIKRGRGRPKSSKSLKVTQVFEPWRHHEMPAFVPLWSMPPHIRDELMCRIINRSIEMRNLKKECERQKAIINATAHLVMEYNLEFGKESETAKVKNFTELARKFPMAVKLFLSSPSTHEFMRKMYLEVISLHTCVPVELQEQLMYQEGNLAETLESKLIELRQSTHKEVREKSTSFKLFWLSFRSFLTGAEAGKSDTLSFAFDQQKVTVYSVKNNYTGIVTKHYVIQGDVIDLPKLLQQANLLGEKRDDWPKLGESSVLNELG